MKPELSYNGIVDKLELSWNVDDCQLNYNQIV